ncbi:MAG: hypothetical protein CMP54_00720 [Flavobacteriales bacterium]|nr:hypothetical protein [Flavobacteriales bacterium]|tara:strand:+ start:2665 stop:2946 length:282 start_codon:yes stop_codon:yes gene_type:complete
MLENQIIQSAVLLKSIGHPIRVQIIIALSEKSVMTVTQLSDYLNIDQPVMSLHLAVLRNKHIIQVKKQGKKSLYSIADISVKQIINIIYHSRK